MVDPDTLSLTWPNEVYHTVDPYIIGYISNTYIILLIHMDKNVPKPNDKFVISLKS